MTLERLLELRGELGHDRIWNDGLIDNWTAVIDHPDEEREEEKPSEIDAMVIEAINQLTKTLCHLVARDSRALRQLSWRQLEEVVATSLAGIGFEVTLTPGSKDGGKDVIAECIISGKRQTYFIEIKHWLSGKRVSSRLVFDFIEVNVSASTAGGIFLSSSGFARDVYSHMSELCRKRITLGSEDKIVSVCQHFSRRCKGVWTPSQTLPEIMFEKTLPDMKGLLPVGR
jgi:restriction system protein